MLLPDVNVLVHAYNRDSPWHEPARRFWEGALSATRPVALSWVAVNAYLRLMTHARVVSAPIDVVTAERDVRSWLARPQVVVVHPTDRHAELFFGFLRALGTAGNLTTDAHLAALAVEHDAEVVSTDTDFARFPGVRVVNPLAA